MSCVIRFRTGPGTRRPPPRRHVVSALAWLRPRIYHAPDPNARARCAPEKKAPCGIIIRTRPCTPHGARGTAPHIAKTRSPLSRKTGLLDRFDSADSRQLLRLARGRGERPPETAHVTSHDSHVHVHVHVAPCVSVCEMDIAWSTTAPSRSRPSTVHRWLSPKKTANSQLSPSEKRIRDIVTWTNT